MGKEGFEHIMGLHAAPFLTGLRAACLLSFQKSRFEDLVYWSGTGNTEQMAHAVLEGAKKAGAEAQLFEVEQFGVSDMERFDGFAFGCPAMGDEVLEEGSFEPFFTEAEERLSGVPVALFGSYGWGGGAWMESWAERTQKDGAKLVSDGLAIENGPTDEGLAQCEKLGADLAAAV